MPKIVPFIQFDFTNYVPDQNLSSGTVLLDAEDCVSNTLAVTLKAQNLVPGHAYQTQYDFLNPHDNPTANSAPFNPAINISYASYNSQNFATTVNIPDKGSYIFKATITDVSEGENTGASGSTQILLKCGIEESSFFVEIIDPDVNPPPRDDIIDLNRCDNNFPLIGLIKNAKIGKLYEYTFYDNPANSIVFENKKNTIFAGDITQNFNSKIALTGNPYVYVHASVKDIDTGIIKNSAPVLLKCHETYPCNVVLPTGVDVLYNSMAMKKCQAKGCTAASLTKLNGGSNFAVGDRLAFGGGDSPCIVEITKVGLGYESINTFGGGSGIKIGSLFTVGGGSIIEVVSVGLTKNSINSLNGCGGFKIGDLLTTVGGGGEDAIIKVLSTGVNGSIGSYDVLNPGFGYTYAPTGVKNLTGTGACVSASFNMDNGTIPFGGGVTNDSFTLSVGSGYQLNDILDINGVGGSGAKAQVIALSLTNCSISSLSGGSGYTSGDYITTSGCGGKDAVIKIINVSNVGAIQGWEIINGGYDYTCVPSAITKLTGNGTGGTFVGSDCWALQSEGGVTKTSLLDLIGTGSGYAVGDKLYVDGGGCQGGIVQITKVNNVGAIQDFVILDSGCCCVATPTIRNEDGDAIVPQPSVDTSAFIKDPIIVINAGSGYGTANNPLVITDSNGDVVTGDIIFKNDDLIPIPGDSDGSIRIINPGSFPPPNGPVSPPVCLPSDSAVCSGVGGIVTSYDIPIRGSIPCSGSITKASITNLIGKGNNFNLKDIIKIQAADGGTGAGAEVIVTSVSGGFIQDFEVYKGGCYYSDPPYPLFYKQDGTLIPGVVTNGDLFTNTPITVVSPGDIKGDGCRSCCQTITGYGECPPQDDIVFENHFVELPFAPTPAVTPSPTVTPSVSELAQCNDIQTAGGQNTIGSTTISITALSGQNYLIVENALELIVDSVVYANGITIGSSITRIDPWFSDFNDRTVYKKITLNNPIVQEIAENTTLQIYNTDIRLIKVPYWPGNMTFNYNAYSVPDRFKVFAVPLDTRQPDILLFDSGYRGNLICGYANNISGIGQGEVTITKPDGCIYVKVIVEAPCDGTAWEYALSCPTRIFTTITATPTATSTVTPTPTPTSTPS